MKRILASLLVLALVAPAMAVDFTVTDAGDGKVNIAYTAAAGEVLRGLALKVTVTGADIEAGTDVVDSVFNAHIDAAYTMETATPNSYTLEAGSGLAKELEAGALADDGPVAVVSLGVLDQSENQGGAPEGTDLDVITIQLVNFSGSSADVCVTEDGLRGNVVGDNLATTTITGCPVSVAAPGPAECFSSAAGQKYTDWLAFGSPDCWCYQKNCNGDADGLNQGNTKDGLLAVYTNDLTILSNAYNIKEPPKGLGVDATGICADFDRQAQGNTKDGLIRVYTNDLTILSNNYNVKEPPKGLGVPVCPLTTSGGDIVYYTN